jgi:sugar-specific transcriptional regulator TrmB
MLNNVDTITYLHNLGLSVDEAKIYLELLKGPRSHLELARASGVNRTKIYRLADQLEKRSLITMQTDDRGTLIAASDPTELEVEIVNNEEQLKNQRAIYNHILPQLETLKMQAGKSPDSFMVQTYEGVEGFKQMLWHELKTTDELVIFGSGSLEDLVGSKRWAENHRSRTVEMDYKLRELVNPNKKQEFFTSNREFMNSYDKRYLPENTLRMDHQVCVYNDTVSTFCWRDAQKVGVEVINAANAQMMRQMFESYWKIAKPK